MDAIVIAILPDINNYDDLIAHSRYLKQLFYPDRKAAVADARYALLNPAYIHNLAVSRLGDIAFILELNRQTNNDDDNPLGLNYFKKQMKQTKRKLISK